MRKFTAVASVLVLLGCGSAPSNMGPRAVWMQAEAMPSVLLVQWVNGKGSAVALSRRWVLTAKHVLPAVTVGGARVLREVVHPTLDLALLEVGPDQPWTPVRLASQMPRPWDRLVAAGYHLGRGLRITDGRQGGEKGTMSCPIIFGASGGAVLNERLELVGIISQLAMLPDPFGGGIPITHCGIYVPVVDLGAWILSNVQS